jgi:dUTP pyrophosphatase
MIRYQRCDPNVPELRRHSAGAAGLDLVAASMPWEGERIFPDERGYVIFPGKSTTIATGIAVELPAGTCGLVLMRSKYGIKGGLQVHVGLIDPDYRGEIFVAVFGSGLEEPLVIPPYERFAQLLVVPFLDTQPVEVEALGETARGSGWGGSTG